MAAALVAGAPAAGATTTATGSLVFIKNQQVYVAEPDGTQARAVTPAWKWWAWPSESSNGIIAVAGGAERANPGGTSESSGSAEIYAVDQQGRSLLSSPVETPGSVSSPNYPTYVTHFRISPDGSEVAYNVLGTYAASGASTFVSPLRSGGTDWSDFQDDYLYPDWVNASQDPDVADSNALGLTHNGASVWGNAEYAIYHASNSNDGDGSGWGNDSAIPDGWGFQATYSPDVQYVALFLDDTADNGGTTNNVEIHFERLTYTDNSQDLCTLDLPASKFSNDGAFDASPTISADGSLMAWAADDGIYEADISDPSNCTAVQNSVHLAIPGGSMPSFGAAPLSAPVVAKPVASLRGPSKVRARHWARFDGSGSHETGGQIVGYRWQFGDGKSASGARVRHAFRRPGHYTVRLTVTDSTGQRATARRRVTVTR